MQKKSAIGGTILRATISIALLAFIILRIEWATAVELVRSSDPLWWLVALLLTVAAVAISAYKWQLVLHSQSVRVPFSKLVSSYFIGLFLNNFLPTSMGGDVFRAYDVAGISGDGPKAVASVVAERVLAMATLAVTAVAGLIFGFRHAGRFTWLVIGFSFGCALLVWGCLDIRWASYLARKISFANTDKIRRKVEETKEALKAPIRDRTALFNVLVLSLGFQIIVVAVNFAVFKALRIDTNLLFLLIFVPIISAVSMLPISINGIGVQQGVSVVFFGTVGISATQATAQSLGFLLIVALASLPGFLLLMTRKGQKEVVS